MGPGAPRSPAWDLGPRARPHGTWGPALARRQYSLDMRPRSLTPLTPNAVHHRVLRTYRGARLGNVALDTAEGQKRISPACRLVLQNIQRALQPLNLVLPALLALRVAVGLRRALRAQLFQVLQDRVQLLLHPGAVRIGVGYRLLQAADLVLLALHRGLLARRELTVVLGRRVILVLRVVLLGARLRQGAGEVALRHLEETDDARRRVCGGAV